MFLGLSGFACGSDGGEGEATASKAATSSRTPGAGAPGGMAPADAPNVSTLPPAAAQPGQSTALGEESTPSELGKEAEVCQSEAYDTRQLPPDILIMLDQSQSMGEELAGTNVTRWQGVTDAIRAFVNDPRAEQVGVGLQYFGLTADEACDPAKYSTPDVPIGRLPNVAGAIATSLDNAAGPSAFTPTNPALAGALMHAKEHAGANPGRPTAVLLATDGFPFGVGDCNDSVQAISTLAEEAASWDPPVRTYLLGVSEGLADLRSIAEKGGGRAYLIGQDDIKNQFTEAMIHIVTTPLGCELKLPVLEGNTSLNPALVRVTIHLTGQKNEIPKVGSEADCRNAGGEGWYYDNDADPTAIVVCEAVCGRLTAGNASVELGCAPRLVVPR